MTIIERYTDDAGKYRVVVEVDKTRAIPLKFQQEVKDDVAFSEAQKILNIEAEQHEQQEYLDSLLAEEKQLLEDLQWK